MNSQLQVGDVLESVNPTALARRVLVIEVTSLFFKAAVLEGDNTSKPITVFKAGWPLYAKIYEPNHCRACGALIANDATSCDECGATDFET